MGKKKELAVNTLIIFIGKACTQFISILLLPLYTKFLISEEYGFVDLVTTYVSLFVPVLSLELEMATFRFLVDNRNNEKEKKNIISTIFWTLLIISVIASIVYLIVINFLQIKYKYLIVLVILTCFFSQYFMQVARGLGKTINYSISCCVVGITTVILNVILIAILKFKADGMLFSIILANILSIIYLLWSLKIKKYLSIKIFNKNLLKKMLKYSIPLIPNGISWWIVNASDRTIISYFLGVSANGIYAVSNKFSSLFIGAFNVFQLSWTESVSVHINDEDSEKFFSSVMNSILKLFISIGISIIAFMPIIFRLFIDDKYIESYNNIPILMVAMIFNVVVGLYSSLYIAKKMTKQVMNTSIISAIINIIINVLCIKYIGLYAASISTLIAYAVMAIYRHYDFKKVLKIKWNIIGIIESVVIGGIICLLYYQNNNISNYIMMIIALCYFSIELKRLYPNIKRILKRKE